MESDLEALWPAAETPPGFAERVVERALSEPSPAPMTPTRSPVLRSWARWAAPVLAMAALSGMLFMDWRLHRHEHGAVYAAEPREIRIGERATALLSTGAQLEWNGSSVQQARGDVEYRVQPGGPFVVQTPFGTIEVLGTIFRVRLAEEEEEQSMKTSKRTIAVTGLTAGALLVVAVREGTVRLSTADRQIVLSKGQVGTIGADGLPMRVDPPSVAQHEPARASEPPAALRKPEGQRRAFDRLRADAVRRRAAERNGTLPDQAAALAPAPASGPAAPSVPPTPEEQEHRRQYIRDAVREQYFPIARSCYEELLARQPRAAGKVVMSFAIVGDGDAGVVDRVELGEGTTMDDPEFTTCMRESMYSTVFEPPPPGQRETTVVYPIELAPGEPEDGAHRTDPGKVEQNSH
jgi:hypothetical protein